MEHMRNIGAASGLAGIAAAIGHVGNYVDSLRERMRLLEVVLEQFPGGICLYDASLRLVLCNRRQLEMLDYPPHFASADGPTLEQIFRFNAERGEYGPGDVEDHVNRRMELVRRGEEHCYDRTRPNGRTLEIRGAPLPDGGFITTYVDVTEQRRTQQLVAHMAHHDALTDLPNRMLFHDRLKTAIAQIKRGGILAIHYIDLDNFKPVNDQLGHSAGDELLVSAAGRMRQSVREHDTIARLGGDEFAIIQTNMQDPHDAGVLAARLMRNFEPPFQLSSHSVKVGASVGIAVAPDDGLSSDDLLMKADNALYRSKASGRGCFSFFRKPG